MVNKDSKKILVVKNRAFGDAIISLGTLRYIKEIFPDSQIFYAVPSWISPFFKGAKPFCDGIIPLNLSKAKDWWFFLKEIRKISPDIVYEMHQSGRTAKFFKLYSSLFSTPYFFHNHHLKEGTSVHGQGEIKSNIQRDLDGVWSAFAKDKEARAPEYLNYTPSLEPLRIKSDQKKRVVFGVIATRSTKSWTIESFSKLAQKIASEFPDYEIAIPIGPAKFDHDQKQKLIEIGMPTQAVFYERPLNELVELFSGSALYIGNDTGIKHLAVALGIKTITFFGPEDPKEWHPYDREQHPYFFIDPLECRTRTAHYCGLNECEMMDCMKQITIDQIAELVTQILKQKH